jgi:hypothetical protein
MPDDARVLFGLAPVHADTLTGHAEISRVFTGQAEANAELREHAAAATRIDVLAVRALGLIALNDSLLRGPFCRSASRSANDRRPAARALIHSFVSPDGWSGKRASWSRRALVAGSGSADRNAAKNWPG